jgi:putative endopeptidase
MVIFYLTKGEKTLNENLADLGGIVISYHAFQRWLASHPTYKPAKSQFTLDQTFFLSYAQSWAENTRPDVAAKGMEGDPHSPAPWRVDGILNNVPEFYKAFEVNPGDNLYVAPEKRVSIWSITKSSGSISPISTPLSR